MKQGNTKIFNNKAKLSQMLNLRLNGFALTSLAILFNCDVMSIHHKCQKYQIKPLEETYTIERILRNMLPKTQALTYKEVNGEKINLGKNYAEYVSTNLRK